MTAGAPPLTHAATHIHKPTIEGKEQRQQRAQPALLTHERINEAQTERQAATPHHGATARMREPAPVTSFRPCKQHDGINRQSHSAAGRNTTTALNANDQRDTAQRLTMRSAQQAGQQRGTGGAGFA